MSKKYVAPTLAVTADLFRSSLRRVSTHPTIMGYRPQEQQVPFHASRAKGKLALGGNRAGKTVAGATEVTQKMCGIHQNQKKPPPVAWRGVASSLEEGIKKIMIPELQKWIPTSQLKFGSWEASYDAAARVLTLENGSTIEFLTNEQDVQKHAGTSRDGVWFDEEPSQAIFNENMIRLADVDGEWIMTMTPLLDMSWTYNRLYLEGLKPEVENIEVFHFDTLDNPYVDEGVLAELLIGMSDEEKAARTHGTYYNLSGGIYTKSLSAENFIDPIINTEMWNLYKYKWGHFGMLDHGYTNPTAFHLACYDEHGNVIVYEEYIATKTLVRDNAREILGLIRRLGLQEIIDYTVADPSIRNTQPIEGKSIHEEYGENGLYLVLGNNDVKAGILRVNGMIARKQLKFTSNCENLMKEIPQYRWAKYSSSKTADRNNPQEQPTKKDDHSMDAIRYGMMSRPELFGGKNQPVGNILNAPEAIVDGVLMDAELKKLTYKDYDNPGIFDDILGNDW
jgi:phage terminase large subunit-like protein